MVIEVVSNLGGTVFFHWWIDGAYLGMTVTGRMEFQVADGEQSRITVHDTTDAAFDPIGSGQAPRFPPARMTAAWYKSLEADTAYYQVWMKEETNVPAEEYHLIGTVPHDPARWLYTFLSPRSRGFGFSFDIRPVDKAGNIGTAMVQVGPPLTIAQPLAPDWIYAWEFVGAGTRRVTYAAAP